jgi:hypothetical protein
MQNQRKIDVIRVIALVVGVIVCIIRFLDAILNFTPLKLLEAIGFIYFIAVIGFDLPKRKK